MINQIKTNAIFIGLIFKINSASPFVRLKMHFASNILIIHINKLTIHRLNGVFFLQLHGQCRVFVTWESLKTEILPLVKAKITLYPRIPAIAVIKQFECMKFNKIIIHYIETNSNALRNIMKKYLAMISSSLLNVLFNKVFWKSILNFACQS